LFLTCFPSSARLLIPELSEILSFRVFDSPHLLSVQQIFLASALHTDGTVVEKDSAACPLKIETESHGKKTTIRLIGRFQTEHVEELKKQLQNYGPTLVLDLKEVTLVDVDVVRFLTVCEANNVKIVQCPRYIRQWMVREQT
jgi:hypothetical protein